MDNTLKVVNEEGKAAKLFLSGTIRRAYPWENEDVCISAERVRKELDQIGNKGIEVFINSGGGDVFESVEICNLFKMHKGGLKIVVTGRAGSGASVICTAGKVSMFGNAMQMVHKALTEIFGNADALRKRADTLDKIDTSVRESYKSKFAGTEQELVKLIAEEAWLTAEECLAFGFCDEIIDEAEEPKNNDTKESKVNIKESLFAKYRKEPPNNEEPPAKGGFFNFKKTEVSS